MVTTKTTNKHVDVYEAAMILHCFPQYVYTLIRIKRIKAERKGRRWLLDRASVEQYRRQLEESRGNGDAA
jgi:excisionase family DNA binding protein